MKIGEPDMTGIVDEFFASYSRREKGRIISHFPLRVLTVGEIRNAQPGNGDFPVY